LAQTHAISIVDDDGSVSDALTALIGSLHSSAAAFNSGASFPSSDHRRRTNVLIADVQMPGMTRLEHHRILAKPFNEERLLTCSRLAHRHRRNKP